MNLGTKGEILIKSFEKLRLVAYLPTPKDKWTIGWGHTGGDVVEGTTCTVAEAEMWFQNDVTWAVHAVVTRVKVPLTQNQFDALVSFVFNIGVENFKESTLLKLLNDGNAVAAVGQFERWNKQGGEVLAGLTARREAERKLFCDSH